MAHYDDLPYRSCVGMMLLNSKGLVFIGRRAGGPEHVDQAHVWQMPQGGIDPGEDHWQAARRELLEETSARSVEKLAEAKDDSHRVQELADTVHLSQSALSRVIGRLERDGLVSRSLCPDDRRGIFVCLTDAGRAKHAEARRTHRAVLTEHLTS